MPAPAFAVRDLDAGRQSGRRSRLSSSRVRFRNRDVIVTRSEGAVALVEEYRDSARVGVRCSEIKLSVTVEVAARDGDRPTPRFVRASRHEGTVATVTEYGDGVPDVVCIANSG